MHEASFTEEIVHQILTELSKHPQAKPTRVKVRVGEMLHLVPDSVRAHFALLTQGTDLAQADLELEETQAKVACFNCGHHGAIEDHHLLKCPKCGSNQVRLTEGDHVQIESIEVEAPVES